MYPEASQQCVVSYPQMCASQLPCFECSQPVGYSKRNDKKFCCDDHKQAFMNRRKVRGMQLLDLVMIARFDRPTAKEKKVWSIYSRMISNWHAEDVAAGRASNLPLNEVLERQVQHVAVQGRVSRSRT